MCRHLNRTGAIYYFRRPVPKDLIGQFQTDTGGIRSEWKVSLDTTDREAAKSLVLLHQLDTDRQIEERRKQPRPDAATPAITPSDAAQEEREALEAEEAAKLTRYNERRAYRVAVRQRMRLSTAELTPEEAAWRDIVREGANPETVAAAVAGQEAANDALAVRMGRAPAATPTATLDGLIVAYEADKAPGWSGSSKKAVVPVFRLLREEFAGRSLDSITRADARAVVKLLEQLPLYIGKRRELKDLSIRQAIAKGKALSLPTIQPKTINDGYLIHMAALWNWAVKEQWVTSSPFIGLSVHDAVDDAERRDPFTPAQLKTLFSTAPWTKPWQAGGDKPGAYWVPLLCMYHGLRNGEAAGLRVEDIGDDDGVPVIRIRAYDGKRLKTKDARGTLPIHPELLCTGFLSFWAERQDAGADLLFPEGTANGRGQIGAKLAERFSTHVRSLGLTGRKLGTHSFRHCFEDRLRSAELPERTALALARRTEAGSSRVYGDGLSSRQKAQAIAKIVYPGLDLSHLYAAEISA